MAEIDSSIYFRQQQADPFGSYQKGMTLRQSLDEKKQQEAISGAFKGAMQVGPDGKTTLNRDMMLGSLLQGGYGKDAAQLAMQWQKEDEGKTQQQTENDLRRQQIAADANFKRQAFGLDAQRFGLEQQKVLAGLGNGENLPIDKKRVVTDLSAKNASKVAIKNQIDAVMNNWDNLPEDQKVAQGRQLLKTLNSTEGADAIGVEEAKRLGAKLEFATGNIFNSNPLQFGRDLGGFKEQASLTSKAIGDAVGANQSIIDENMGRPKKAAPSEIPHGTIEDGFIFYGGDPSDSKNWKKVK